MTRKRKDYGTLIIQKRLLTLPFATGEELIQAWVDLDPEGLPDFGNVTRAAEAWIAREGDDGLYRTAHIHEELRVEVEVIKKRSVQRNGGAA